MKIPCGCRHCDVPFGHQPGDLPVLQHTISADDGFGVIIAGIFRRGSYTCFMSWNGYFLLGKGTYMTKKAIVVASFGTSKPDTLQKTILAVEQEVQNAYPHWQVVLRVYLFYHPQNLAAARPEYRGLARGFAEIAASACARGCYFANAFACRGRIPKAVRPGWAYQGAFQSLK